MERLISAIDRQDWPTLISLFAPDAVYEVPGRHAIRGHEQLLHYYRHERDIVDGQHHVDGVLEGEHHAASWGTFKARTSAGELIDTRFVDLCRFDDGLIGTRVIYFFAPPLPPGEEPAERT